MSEDAQIGRLRELAHEMNEILEVLAGEGVDVDIEIKEELEPANPVLMKKLSFELVKVVATFCALLTFAGAGCNGEKMATVERISLRVNGEWKTIDVEGGKQRVPVRELRGACVSPDLSTAKVLIVGQSCPEGWLVAPGDFSPEEFEKASK